MINGYLEQFLDTGWYSEATLFLDGYLYWCEANTDPSNGITSFIVDKWRAINEDNKYYHSIIETDGTIKWERVFEYKSEDLEYIKKQFLEAPIFGQKTFWQVEKKIAWLEDGNPIKAEDLT